MEFVQAKYYDTASDREVRWIVIHSTESPERPDSAEATAKYFQNPPKKVSAHFCVDNESVIQCVRTEDVAYHAGNVNRKSVGVEHVGYHTQTTQEWLDPYSKAMLEKSASLVAGLCLEWDVPVAFVDAAGIDAGWRGITTHAEVSKSHDSGTDHTDPGPEFPRGYYVQRVRHYWTLLGGPG